MTFDKGRDCSKKNSVLDFYEETSANILKAYTHNKEALRLHEKGYYKAAKHHATRVHGLSLKATEQIGMAMELAERLNNSAIGQLS